MSGSTPHTIAQAVEAFRRRKQQQQQTDSSTTATTAPPIDLVAVVLDVTTTNNTTRTPVARIWIRDTSLTKQQNCRCQVLIFGKQKVDRIANEWKLRRGDIVRFNRVQLLSDQAQQDDGTPVYTFKHSFHDPEAGEEFFRLLQIHGGGGSVVSPPPTLVRVPDSMRTNPAYMENLIVWYQSSEYYCSETATSLLLPPLTCQYRSLSELQSCQGVISHVVATVLQVETHSSRSVSSGRMRQNKRRRASSSGVAAPPPSSTYAILTDDNGKTLTTFLLDNLRIDFQKVLTDACDAKQPVRLSSVVSKQQAGGCHRDKSASREEVLLLPTPSTDIALATAREVAQQQERYTANHTQGEQATQLSATMSMSQQRQHQQQQQQLDFRSPLLDIQVHGVSLVRNQAKYLQDPSKLCSFLQSDGDVAEDDRRKDSSPPVMHYASAVLTITEPDDLGRINVEADGAVLRVLCGGLNLSEWRRNDGSLSTSSSSDDGIFAVHLLRGLLTEEIELRWILEVQTTATGTSNDHSEGAVGIRNGNNGNYRVLRVSLPHL